MKSRQFHGIVRLVRTSLGQFAGSYRFLIRVNTVRAKAVRPYHRYGRKIHDLLRWSDWILAYRATAEFFDRRLTASGERK